MDARTALEYEWPYLLSFFPDWPDLEASAFQTGAIRRRRAVNEASSLLRLALAYGFCGFSLRQTAAWAQATKIADLSDVALLNRLRKAADWLGHLLAVKLAERAGALPGATPARRLRVVDATTVSRPGSTGTDWRLHLAFNLASWSIDQVQLTGAEGGESLTRFEFSPGDLILGDRGYGHRKGLEAVLRVGADFIVRIGWQNLPLWHAETQRFDVLAALRALPDARPGSYPVRLTPHPGSSALRFVAVRKTETSAQEAREKLLRERQKKGKSPDPRSLEACGYIFVLTSLPSSEWADAQVLECYRFRWQIELAFKRLKSLLQFGVLPAKDAALARTILYSKLLAALMLDDYTERFLSFSPWGYPLH
jgi:hypothetical protein